MPVYYDTELGWECDSISVVLTAGFFGQIQKAILPIELPYFLSQPSAADIMAKDCYFYYNGVPYWYAFYTNSSHSLNLRTAIVRTDQNAYSIMIISDQRAQSTGYRYSVAVTDGTNVWTRTNLVERSTINPDPDSGLYYGYTTNLDVINSTVFPQSPTAGTSGSVIIDGPNAANVLAHFIPVPTRFYKYTNDSGEYPAASGFVKWINTNGEPRTSPFQISSVPDNTLFSYDNTSVASDAITVGMLKDGIHFKMGFFAQYDGVVSGNVTPVYDLTSVYPNGIGIGGVMEKLMELTYIRITNSPDPYGDTSEEEGGEPTDPDDDPVEEETLPLPSVAGLGFCTIYVPSDTDLLQLSQYLWGGNLDLDNFLKLFANPMDSILGLSAVPVSLPGTPSPVYMGGQILENITLPKFTGRTYIKVDMGTMTIEERWGSYLDYDPYTELSLYLPFIGIKNIKADDVMGKTISLTYSLDILSGACVAYIRPAGESVLYEWSGQCAMQIPITGQNWDNVFATATATAVSLGAALFAPSAISAGAIASTAVQAVSAKPRVERSGAVSGLSGFLGQLRPYLIRVIPEAYIPNEQNKFIGYPSFITKNLGTLTGYNEVSSIHLEGVPATGNELSEIETLLKGGVIF